VKATRDQATPKRMLIGADPQRLRSSGTMTIGQASTKPQTDPAGEPTGFQMSPPAERGRRTVAMVLGASRSESDGLRTWGRWAGPQETGQQSLENSGHHALRFAAGGARQWAQPATTTHNPPPESTNPAKGEPMRGGPMGLQAPAGGGEPAKGRVDCPRCLDNI
jgi:hypothetical protein